MKFRRIFIYVVSLCLLSLCEVYSMTVENNDDKPCMESSYFQNMNQVLTQMRGVFNNIDKLPECISSAILFESHNLLVCRNSLPDNLTSNLFKIEVDHYDFTVSKPEVLSSILHMKTCFSYYSLSPDAGNLFGNYVAENVFSYVHLNDIHSLQDVKEYHRYLIVKSKIFERKKNDSLLVDIFKYRQNIELVIDFENEHYIPDLFTYGCLYLALGKKVNNIQFISVIGSNLTGIGDYFLCYCKKLKLITLSNDIKYIGKYFLYSCENLRFFSFPSKIRLLPDYCLYMCLHLSNIIMQKNIESIGGNVFAECEKLSDLMLSENLINIGENFAFRCEKITSVSFSDTLVSIGGGFMQMTGLVEFAVPRGLRVLPDGFLSLCRSLESIDIENGIEVIGDDSLKGCCKLEELILPSSVKYIGNCFLYNCEKLKYLNIKGDLIYFGSKFLFGCVELKNGRIIIPATMNIEELCLQSKCYDNFRLPKLNVFYYEEKMTIENFSC